MNAGLDMCTAMIGRGLCSSFSFPTTGQLLLRASLDQLITVRASVERILEFGFGLKSTVYTLCETEQGSFCVALSAALAFPYTSFQAAQIWREYCILRGTPANFNPSVHQWVHLIDVCSGSLHKSNFRHHFDVFSRTLCPEASSSNLAAPPAEVAKALATLADLSQRKISNAVFVGGIECAWLAAVAKCLLCLPIEVHDKSGHCSYQFMPSPGACFQATFKSDDCGRNQDSNSALVQRTCFVTSGTALLHERVDFLTSVIRHRSSWSTILSDSFISWNLFSKVSGSKAFWNSPPACRVTDRGVFLRSIFKHQRKNRLSMVATLELRETNTLSPTAYWASPSRLCVWFVSRAPSISPELGSSARIIFALGQDIAQSTANQGCLWLYTMCQRLT
jgi:hypothetical protein